MEEKEKRALFQLSAIENLSPARIRRMYDYVGSFTEALLVSEEEYVKAGIIDPSRDRTYRGAFGRRSRDTAFLSEMSARFDRMNDDGIRMITFEDAEMPGRFSVLEDPPVCLYVKGKLPADDIPSVSVIGARNCSEYGRSIARFFSAELASAGLQVVSGMALGIDSAASYGALLSGHDSYAVLGSGVDICYPGESRSIYEKMCEGNGGVISEYAPGTQAISWHFIARNRLIAALGDVLIVIEAKVKSGTSITVGDALSQGKDIFALPGRITDPLGAGCNQLIRDGAIVLTCPDDVLTHFGIAGGRKAGPAAPDPGSLSPEQKKILDAMGPDPLHTEDISLRTDIPIRDVISHLCYLELSGLVRSSDHAYFVKVFK